MFMLAHLQTAKVYIYIYKYLKNHWVLICVSLKTTVYFWPCSIQSLPTTAMVIQLEMNVIGFLPASYQFCYAGAASGSSPATPSGHMLLPTVSDPEITWHAVSGSQEVRQVITGMHVLTFILHSLHSKISDYKVPQSDALFHPAVFWGVNPNHPKSETHHSNIRDYWHSTERKYSPDSLRAVEQTQHRVSGAVSASKGLSILDWWWRLLLQR